MTPVVTKHQDQSTYPESVTHGLPHDQAQGLRNHKHVGFTAQKPMHADHHMLWERGLSTGGCRRRRWQGIVELQWGVGLSRGGIGLLYVQQRQHAGK